MFSCAADERLKTAAYCEPDIRQSSCLQMFFGSLLIIKDHKNTNRDDKNLSEWKSQCPYLSWDVSSAAMRCEKCSGPHIRTIIWLADTLKSTICRLSLHLHKHFDCWQINRDFPTDLKKYRYCLSERRREGGKYSESHQDILKWLNQQFSHCYRRY